MKKTLIIFIGVWLSAFQLISQEAPLWMRYPAISADGKTIAFSYKGDLYTVPANGGEAKLITIHEAFDFMPIWSPDGKFIVFASDRHGNFDIYLIPAEGGKARRLTTHSARELPCSFSPDGKFVLFSASIQDDPDNVQFPSGVLSELYKVPVEGGRIIQILSTPAEKAVMDKNQKYIIYQDRKGYESPWRKHHVSSVTRDIWLYDQEKGQHTKLTVFEGEDRNPVFSPDDDEIYYLSEGSGSFNIWKLPVMGAQNPTRITFFENNPLRFLSIANNGTLCFGYNGEIYTQAIGEEPQKVDIRIIVNEKENQEEFMKLTSGATEMAVSPDGKQIALIIRGEVFVTSTDFKTTKRITNTPEQERSVSFSPDGKKLLYASERNGSWNLYQTKIVREEEPNFSQATILEEEPVLETEEETFQPAYSPDGNEIAYLEEREILKVINLETKQIRTILDGKYNYSYRDGDQWYQWSPDGKWFLVGFKPYTAFNSDVALVSSDGNQELENLTLSGYQDAHPKWMMKGKMMIWFTDRNGYRSHGSWGSHDDVYGMFFTQEAFDRFNLTEEETELLEEKEKKEKKDENGSEKDKEKKKKEKEEEKIEPIVIDTDGIEDRKKKLTIHSSALADAVLTPDGKKLYYLSKFEKGYDLWMNDLVKKETKLVLKLNGKNGNMKMDKEGKTLFIFSGGKIMKIDTKDNKKKDISYCAEFNLNKPVEKAYMFEHVWRQVLKKFYDPGLHGTDWDFYKKEYARFLPYINNNYDYAEMLSEMLGELNASHTGCSYRHSEESRDKTSGLGVFFDYSYDGNGLKVAEVINKGPLDKAGSKIKPGHIIEKIDNIEIAGGMDYFPLLNHKKDKPTLLSVYDPETKERWEETVKPVSMGEEYELLYKRWVEKMKKETERLSDGHIGYIHVRSMSSRSFREFYSEALGRNHDKEALIVDTRFNGGGWLHDDLVTILGGKKYADFYPRGRCYGWEPMNKWVKPSVVLISESNYSDANGFPYAYKALGIGKLVGMPVPGTMTAVWWENLQDKSLSFGIPQVGMKDMNGNYLENQQLEPDYKVSQDPAIVVRGRDEQLEKAVEVLLHVIDEEQEK